MLANACFDMSLLYSVLVRVVRQIILKYSGQAAVFSHHSHDISVALAILLLKKPSK